MTQGWVRYSLMSCSTDQTSVITCLPCPLNCRDWLYFLLYLGSWQKTGTQKYLLDRLICILLLHFWPALGSLIHWWNCLPTRLAVSLLTDQYNFCIHETKRPSPCPHHPTSSWTQWESLGCSTLFVTFSWKMGFQCNSPIFPISRVVLMVRGKLEATILPSAVLTSHRKGLQGTVCLCTGSAAWSWNDSRPSSLQAAWGLAQSKPFCLTEI